MSREDDVKRLVNAAKPFVAAMDLAKAALRQHPDVGHLETLAALYTGWTDRKELRAALAAMDTPKGGGE